MGRNGTVGWFTYVTGGIDLTKTTGSALTLYVDRMYAGGTLKVYALTQPVTVSEMSVDVGDLYYNSSAPVAAATLAMADQEKVIRLDLGNLLNVQPSCRQ